MWRVLWRPHIPSGAVGRADGPWHASTYMLELLPSVCWIHLQPGFELPWQVCLGLLRPVFVVVQQWEKLPLGAGYHVRVDPSSETGRSECPCRVVLSSHQRSKCQVGALPLDWVRIAAEFDRCAHDTGRKADRHTWVEMSGRLHFFLAGARCLSAGHHLKLTRGPAGNRTTTGSLSHEDT